MESSPTLLSRTTRDEASWPGYLAALTASDYGTESDYSRYPHLFAAAFPEVTPEQLEKLCNAGRCCAFGLFAVDSVIDGDDKGEPTQIPGLEIIALFHTAYRELFRLYAPDSPFWNRFEGCLHRFASAMMLENSYQRGDLDLRELTLDDAVQFAKGKCAIAEVTAHGMAELTGRDAERQSIVTSIAELHVACQLLDDLTDWRADAAAGRPSWPLACAVRAAGVGGAQLRAGAANQTEALNKVGRALYFGGAATSAVDLALAAADRAQQAVEGLPLEKWHAAIAAVRDRGHTITASIRDSIAQSAARDGNPARTRPTVTITLPDAGDDPLRELARATTQWLVQRWQTSFRRDADRMAFPVEDGFSTGDVQVGDVFPRAIITGALIEAEQALGAQLGPVIDREITYLIGARRDEPGLWSYFPTLPELPPDADDLGEILRLAQRRDAIDDTLRPALYTALDLALHTGAHPDGSFETWLIPERAHADATAARQREFAERCWGQGADVEVMGNLLHAARHFDAQRFAGPITRGVRYILDAQATDGTWPTTWYHGPLYAAYTCSRLLADFDTPQAQEALRRCAAVIHAHQLPDGGWASDPDRSRADPVSTSLALLSLAELRRGGHATEPDRIDRAFDRLRLWQRPDGGLPSARFVRMEMGRTGRLPPRTLSYGSEGVTTALACRAAAAWLGQD